MIITDFSAFPVIPVRNGLTCGSGSLKDLEATGMGLVSFGLNKGDVVEFPDNEESLSVQWRQVRKGSDAKEMLIGVYKNGKPAWFSVANLRRWDNQMKAVHPVAEDLRNCESDAVRVTTCFGRKITATEDVTYQEAVFENGTRVDGETKSRTVAKLIWA